MIPTKSKSMSVGIAMGVNTASLFVMNNLEKAASMDGPLWMALGMDGRACCPCESTI